MGLDMYLSAKKYVSGYEFSSEKDKAAYAAILNLTEMHEQADKDTPSATVEITIGYWRKANHIHAWIVKNCANGIDECQPVNMSENDINALEEACESVLQDRSNSNCEYKLPTQAGFFFGGTEFDEWYFEKCEDTLTILSRARQAMSNGYSIEYQASW